jgi:glucuronoarabinoxylan endo-1,4-beta-xylanase
VPAKSRVRFRCKAAAAIFFLISGAAFPATVTVDFGNTHQVIDGFGCCSAWQGALGDTLMDVLFKNGPGQLGLSILRVRIAPDSTKWADEDSNAAKAKARRAMVFATPWSPPVAMKIGTSSVAGGSIDTSKFKDYAAWLKSFWRKAGQQNIDFISLQNEPDYSQYNAEGCSWTPQNLLDFCKNWATQVGKPIMMPETMKFDSTYSDPTLNDATAAARVAYIGWHLYAGQPKKYNKALALGKRVWATEHNFGNSVTATNAMKLAQEIVLCMNMDMSAYCWFGIKEELSGLFTGAAPNLYAWTIASFSKWVRPGYRRADVASYNPQTGIYVAAFTGDSDVVVAVNTTSAQQSVTLAYTGATVLAVKKYTTSQSKQVLSDGTVRASNNSYTVTLDGMSVTTLVSTYDIVPVFQPLGEHATLFRSASPPGTEENLFCLMNGRRLSLGASAPLCLIHSRRGTVPAPNADQRVYLWRHHK